MGSIVSLVTGARSGAWSYLAAACIAALLAGSATGYVVHRMDGAAIAAMKLADQQARTAAIRDAAQVQQSQDSVNLSAAVAEATAQQKIVTETVTVTKEITTHVPLATPCIPFGLVRVLDDAASGSDTADTPAPPGQSDDACAPLSWRAFAGELSDDYGIGRANAQQLNALEADVTALVAAANARSGDDADGK